MQKLPASITEAPAPIANLRIHPTTCKRCVHPPSNNCVQSADIMLAIPSFTPTSSPELDELLLTYRAKVFTPHALQKYHRDLMYKPSRHQILLNDPGVTVTLSNNEEVKLMPMDPHDKPNKGKSLVTLVRLLENSVDSKDWNNLPPFLEGMVMAKEKLPEGWLQTVVRKANERGRSGVIVRCAEMVKKTGVTFADPPIAEEMMLGCHMRAARARWTGEEVENALRQAEQVVLMMKAKEHCGGKLREGQEDMRKSMMVIGVLLELAAARATHINAGKDVDGKVIRYAKNALVLCQQSLVQSAKNHIEAARGLERWLPLWAGFKVAQNVDTVRQSNLASSLRDQAEKLEVAINEAKTQVEEQAVGKPRRCLNMYNEVSSL